MRHKFCTGQANVGSSPAAAARRRALLRSLVALFASSALGPVAKRAGAHALPIGAMAPPATLITLDGQHISTADLRGRVVMLTFWATYCVPCRDELPLLSGFASQHSDSVSVLGFCLDEPRDIDEVRRIASSLSFPVGFMREDSAPGYGRIWRLPANFTIGRDGRLIDDRWRQKDSAWTAPALQQVIVPLLG
jgi:thiol-disulfide isomerase/thioredoxin